MDTTEVNGPSGLWVLKKPNAGVRNKALVKAETDSGFRMTIFMVEIMPKMIAKRPDTVDSTVPIEDILDSIDPEEYDLLFNKARNLMGMKEQEKVGNSLEEKKTESSTT